MREIPNHLLRSFVAVVQTESFTGAADRVFLSQSAVSQHIRRLEQLLGESLFERDTRKLRLTSHGEALHGYAVRILDLVDEAVTAIAGPPLNGVVRLGMSEDFTLTHLTSVLAGFSQRHPGIELEITIGMSGDLFAELDEGRHDLVFAKRLAGSRRGRVVRTETLYWCASPDSLISGDEAVLPLALHPEPSVTRTRVLEVLKAANRPYKITITSRSIAALRASVIAGLGISAFAESAIPEALLRLHAELPPLGELEYVIDRPNNASPAVLALDAILVEATATL
ncbi:MAG TPA: LysR substrate-binding domain-containing protein [Rhodanobacter sp.]